MCHESRRFYADGPWGQIHLTSAGRGPGLLLLHQSPWSSVQYQALLPAIAECGFRAIAPDLPGYGQSDPPPPGTSIEELADSVAAVLSTVNPRPIVAVGHHTGALVAAALAVRHPSLVAGLVLDNAPLYSAAERNERRRALAGTRQQAADGRHLVDRWARIRGAGDAAFSDEAVEAGVIAWCQSGRDEGHRAAFDFELEPALAAIDVPTLLLRATADRLYPHGARLQRRRPDFALATIEGGPATLVDRPREWFAAVLPFLMAFRD